MAQFNFKAIGTTWKIDIYQSISAAEEATLLERVLERIDIFDKAYSRFRTDSLVTQMSKETGIYTLPADAGPMMALYYNLYLRTNGFFTPLVGNLISDAGYDAQYSLVQKKELTVPFTWDEALEYSLVGSEKIPTLIIKKPVMLDFGAAGKGYLIDIVAGVVEKAGVMQYCIDAGGDIFYKNKTPIRVGLEHPTNTKQVIGVYDLPSGSICGSAGNRRVWGKFNHIMNPKTLVSVTDVIAVWVTAPTAMVADAIATCLFFVSAASLADAYDFEYVLVRADFSVEKSARFSGELFSA